MSILRSFNIGVTGINAVGGGLAVVGDNIANAGTNGFKRSRAEFQDVLSHNLKGIDGGDQIGSGTKLAHITSSFTQGTIARTESISDLAINGDGFFSVEAPFGIGFSRDGSFHFDKDGCLVNGDGYKVRGFQADANGSLSNKISQIKLGHTTTPATPTKTVRLQMNLNSKDDVSQFDPKNPLKSSTYNSSITVYDNIGTPRLANVYFNKVEANKWEYHVMVDNVDALEGGPESDGMVEMAKGRLTFSDKGLLKSEEELDNSFNFNKGAAQDQKIQFDFGISLDEGGTGVDATTQYGSNSTVERHFQDGSSASTLTSLTFNDDGKLTAVYSNGETKDVAQIGITKFENNEGLFKLGKNIFKETRRSGQGSMGKPGEGGRGEILSKSIELSNVDIAQEFVDLMTAQRNFQANTRTITSADQMLQEILNLKR